MTQMIHDCPEVWRSIRGHFQNTSALLQKHGVVDIRPGYVAQPVSEINILEYLPRIKHAVHVINRRFSMKYLLAICV